MLGAGQDVELLAAIGAMAVPDEPELLQDVERPIDRRRNGRRVARAASLDELRGRRRGRRTRRAPRSPFAAAASSAGRAHAGDRRRRPRGPEGVRLTFIARVVYAATAIAIAIAITSRRPDDPAPRARRLRLPARHAPRDRRGPRDRGDDDPEPQPAVRAHHPHRCALGARAHHHGRHRRGADHRRSTWSFPRRRPGHGVRGGAHAHRPGHPEPDRGLRR